MIHVCPLKSNLVHTCIDNEEVDIPENTYMTYKNFRKNIFFVEDIICIYIIAVFSVQILHRSLHRILE